MAFSNDMTRLINKIERELGLILITPHLPPEFSKDKWARVIKEGALVSYSRYYKFKVPLFFSENSPKDENGFYLIDEDEVGGEVLGVADLDWQQFNGSNISLAINNSIAGGIPVVDALCCGFEDILGLQMNADENSTFSNGIYLDFVYPNKLRLRSVGNVDLKMIKRFTCNILIQHPNLQTIPPTQMETFEKLAKAYVAEYLYENLKYVENVETIFAQADMKLSDLQTQAQKKDEIMEEIKQNYVSAGNEAVPIMITI